MDNNILSDNRQALEKYSIPVVNKAKLDLVILRYMRGRVFMTLHLLNAPTATTPQPLLYYSEERHPRIHRIAIYQPQQLLQNSSLAFVGFVSGKRQPASPLIVEEIQEVDKKLIAELINIPGILSYSSLELRNGNWCNLVLLNSLEMKVHIKSAKTHAYAAYQLAPRYYDWIRLHHGAMPFGLSGNEMLLQKTRIYTFLGIQQNPAVSERIYNA